MKRQKFATFAKKEKIERECTNDKNYCKVKDHCHYTGIPRCCT